ncbi:hypothetical protein SYNPS1DRAFT_24851 [Syncephalis pseudoplumigaleata]|uniref:RlpA-like double-psi beta-barrel-protein domain-containing protein-containing protein n=1 Tax=Syncephalis pseudoplumigaleata TaxID=1712513 RepID=A0A4P9YT63_9FUNG|nr:hypothetical protein SYNPS1DRAFT_24851 [Syncephalis pseudoplumigaleata]|eukprot:RKP23163.1 hypothetical protein SYNPS1DRAFT_24851 [Syncephalis pseudoplumigaleata]
MHLATCSLFAAATALLATAALVCAAPEGSPTPTTCPAPAEEVLIGAELAANVFSQDKCNTCIYVHPRPNTSGVGVVATVTGRCTSCKDGQAKLPMAAIYTIYGRRPGKFQVPLPPTVEAGTWEFWDCSKPAPPTRSPLPGASTS